jgi:hypothetical protein
VAPLIAGEKIEAKYAAVEILGGGEVVGVEAGFQDAKGMHGLAQTS